MRKSLENLAIGVISLATLTGCASTRIDSEIKPVENYVQDERGLISLYGFGGFGGNITYVILREIDEELVDRGYNKNYISKNPVSYGKLSSRIGWIQQDIEKGRHFVFVAHSLGCKESVRALELMDDSDIPVEVLVLMDPFAFDRKIPSNVKTVLVYRSGDELLNGREITEKDLESSNTGLFVSNLGRYHNDFDNPEYIEVIAHDVSQALSATFVK